MSDAIRPVVMPKWGLAMQEGMVARWLVNEGATIAAGDEIMDIETSKIANVFESPVAGTLRRRVVGEGETVPVGALLAVVTDGAVPDGDIDGYVAKFQEEFAAHAAEAGETGPEPATVEAGGRRRVGLHARAAARGAPRRRVDADEHPRSRGPVVADDDLLTVPGADELLEHAGTLSGRSLRGRAQRGRWSPSRRGSEATRRVSAPGRPPASSFASFATSARRMSDPPR